MIAVVVPVLGRPQNARPLAASLADATTLPHRLEFVCSPGDTAQIEACRLAAREFGARTNIVDWEPGHGDFSKKVNRAYRWTTEPWIFQAADDVTFEPGWDVALMETAEATGALVIGTQDGGNPTVKAGKHSTHTLIARSYIDDPGASMDGPGTVFSEAYGHQHCDTELVELAKARGVWAFCAEARVTHLHPFWNGRRGMDATYHRGQSTARQDATTYRQRQRLWSGKVRERR